MARRKKSRGRFRTRTRSAGRKMRRGGGRLRRFAARHRGRTLGLVGKTGVGIAAGSPLLGSALDAASRGLGAMKQQNLSILSTAEGLFWRFLNGVSVGFGSGQLRGTIPSKNQDGGDVTQDVTSYVPQGAWWKTLSVGGILVVFDIGVSWASRKLARVSSGIRFMGTKLTGGK